MVRNISKLRSSFQIGPPNHFLGPIYIYICIYKGCFMKTPTWKNHESCSKKLAGSTSTRQGTSRVQQICWVRAPSSGAFSLQLLRFWGMIMTGLGIYINYIYICLMMCIYNYIYNYIYIFPSRLEVTSLSRPSILNSAASVLQCVVLYIYNYMYV